MAANRERGLSKHVKTSPPEVDVNRSQQVSFRLVANLTSVCGFFLMKSCGPINQWEVKCFKGKNPQRYYISFHNLFIIYFSIPPRKTRRYLWHYYYCNIIQKNLNTTDTIAFIYVPTKTFKSKIRVWTLGHYIQLLI